MTFRFTLSHTILGSQVISEPDGWEGAKIKLERHKDFFSLIEYYEGAANSAFIFYGRNDAEGIDGGIEFIRQVETTYGFDANITFLVEYAPEDVTFSTVFSGQLDISQKTEMKDNRMQVPVIRDDFWAKLINRYETPVSLSSTEDLHGNAVTPVIPVSVNLTSQKVRQQYDAQSLTTGIDEDPSGMVNPIIADGMFYQMSFDEINFEEINETFVLPQVTNVEEPVPWMVVEFAGTYSFDIQTVAYTYNPGFNFDIGEDISDYLMFYLNINGVETAFTLGDTFSSLLIDGGRVYRVQLNDQVLSAGDKIWIYGKGIADMNGDVGTYSGEIRWNGDIVGGNSLCYARVTADTIYPETQATGYLIHDAIYGVLERIVGPESFYSEFLGGLLTTMRQYDADGCGWMYIILKGLQLRQYTLTEKPFFISMKEIWEGINPILNLGLGYEIVDSVQVIRIEQKGHFIGDTPPVNFSNVREISSSYDQEYIFKTIKTGYKEWQAEQASGLDDPQTKHTRALRFEKVGIELNLESGFIAASLAIEQTRRTTREKSADYKFDNKTFIISLNTDDVSPDVYTPELDENFAAITNLLNPETRYNSILTPLRNFLRWANYFGGCLQSYLTSSYKFVSGEGNYDMASDANLGSCARAVIGDNLSESADIPLGPPTNYNTAFGYFFLPILYEISIPMEKEEFDAIDRKQPIGISQTDSGHAEFHIKELEYEIIKGEATIKAWPKVFFPITVPDQEITNPVCE